MKRLAPIALLALMIACVAPERARFQGGFYAADEIDESVCVRRVAAVELVSLEPPPDASHENVAAPTTGPTDDDQAPPSTAPPTTGPTDGDHGPPGTVAPAGRSGYRVSVGGAAVEVDIAGALRLPGVSVAAEPRVSVGVARVDRREVLPGFLYGVDLRPYRSVVFVVDTTAQMCAAQTPGASTGRLLLDDAIDQVLAALGGLPLDARVSLIAAGGGVSQLVPEPGEAGRRAAMQWTCSLFCESDSSLALALVRAFAEAPDVVVLVSDGGTATDESRRRAAADTDLLPITVPPELAVEGMEYTIPVIAIGVRGYSDRLAAIANLTGGVHVAL